MDGKMIKTVFFKMYSTAALTFLLLCLKKTTAATMNILKVHKPAVLKYPIATLHRQVWHKAVILVSFFSTISVTNEQTHTDIF